MARCSSPTADGEFGVIAREAATTHSSEDVDTVGEIQYGEEVLIPLVL